MSDAAAGTIIIGGREFTVKRPKLGQLRHILDALGAMQGKDGGALIDASVALLIAGLRPAHPDLTVEELLDLESTIAELNSAVGLVLDLAGLKPVETGEAAPQREAA